MNKTSANLNQAEPAVVYSLNRGVSSLPLDVEGELEKYSKIYITRQFDMFRIVHCCEAATREYLIYGETKECDKKLLFTSNFHFECCKCCEQFVCGACCCGFACCDSIIFQMNYNRNGQTFYTQGYNITKGCHCCDICFCPCYDFIPCPGKTLYLRENIDPNNPDITVGRPKGKTQANCACSCDDKYVDYITETNLKGQTVRAPCCDICKNRCAICCTSGCCCCCTNCLQGCDFEIRIEDENGLNTGNIFVFSGCCSEKVGEKMCYFPRPYFEANMPPGANSEQKFQIIADTIHLDLLHTII